MKINGQRFVSKHEVVVPIVRETPLYLICTPVVSTDPFFEICPPPEAPTVHNIKTGEDEVVTDGQSYRKAVMEHTTTLLDWMVIQSVREAVIGAEGERFPIEWENVDLLDSSTFGNWQTELKSEGYSEIEVNRILDGVMQVNSMSDALVEAARKDFLRGQGVREANQFSQVTELPSTTSGVAANA